jgi:hypothetical protein
MKIGEATYMNVMSVMIVVVKECAIQTIISAKSSALIAFN